MSIYDPGNYEDQPDHGTSAWVWVLLGVGALVFCCVAASVIGFAGFALFNADTQAAFDEVAATLESFAPTAVPTPTPMPTAVSTTYLETFSEPTDWGTGTITAEDDPDFIEVEALLNEGTLDFTVYAEESLFWTTAEEDFGDGVYEVQTTAVGGPLDNGFGMLFMFDNERENFYMFEISSDGYVWVGIYEEGASSYTPFLDNGWQASEAVKQGLGASNVLRVEVNNGQMTFYVNNQQVATVQDRTLSRGNIGLFVETFDEGGARVQFDNFSYRSE